MIVLDNSSAYNPLQMNIDWKSRFRKTFKTRLVIIGLIIAIAGWFLLGVMLFGRFFEEGLSGIEEFVQSNALRWGFRILVVGAAIVLIIKFEWLAKALRNKRFKVCLYMFYGVGFIGWLWGIIDLLA